MNNLIKSERPDGPMREYLSIRLLLLQINLCGAAASENRMPPKRFIAWGKINNYKKESNWNKSCLYRSIGALSNFI
jgi:hypothetical protein